MQFFRSPIKNFSFVQHHDDEAATLVRQADWQNHFDHAIRRERKKEKEGEEEEVAKNCHNFLFKFFRKAKIDANTVCPSKFWIG